jgi:hypothetical protein
MKPHEPKNRDNKGTKKRGGKMKSDKKQIKKREKSIKH